jgi:iron(III) transport system substrate-binding protein
VLAVSVLLGASAASALTQQEIADLKGPDRQKILEDGAKKEGKVTFYSAMVADQLLRPLSVAFMKKYPYIKAEYWQANGSAIVQKVLAETSAKSVVGDVVESTDLSEPLIRAGVVVPFNSPELDVYPKEYKSADRYWSAARLNYFSAAYNTDQIKAADAPKTFEDLLDPKWKGKLSWREGSGSGNQLFVTNIIIAMGEQKADEYFQKLAKQNVVNYSGSARALVNGVMAGEYPIALGIFAHHPIISAQKGAPVASIPMEPVPSITGTAMLVKGAPNPHAAMLFIDFLQSKEGQASLEKADYFPVHPDVEINPKLNSIVPRKAGLKENFVTPKELDEYSAKADAVLKKYFKN